MPCVLLCAAHVDQLLRGGDSLQMPTPADLDPDSPILSHYGMSCFTRTCPLNASSPLTLPSLSSHCSGLLLSLAPSYNVRAHAPPRSFQ